MGNSTFTASLSGNKMLLVDARSAGAKIYFEKGGFLYSAKLIVADGDFEANGNLSIVLPGVTKVEGFSIVEDRNGTFAQIVPASITYGTTAGDVKTTVVVAANGSATAMHVLLFGRVDGL